MQHQYIVAYPVERFDPFDKPPVDDHPLIWNMQEALKGKETDVGLTSYNLPGSLTDPMSAVLNRAVLRYSLP